MPPIDDLGLVDAEAVVVRGFQAWPGPDGAIDVHRATAAAAHEVVMVVGDSILVPRRRPCRLDAPDQALVGQGRESVVHRLTRDGADVGLHDLLDVVGRGVWSPGHCSQHGEPLGGHLQAALTQLRGGIRGIGGGHLCTIYLIVDFVKSLLAWSDRPHSRGAARVGGVTIDERLTELGIVLPTPFPPAGAYVAALRAGDLVFLSGAGPVRPDGTFVTGKVGAAVSLDEAKEAARLTGLQLLAALRAEIGDLDEVVRVVKLLGMVNCAPGFDRTPPVIDGCSELFVEVFGERGRGARSAVGMAELPFGISVEIEAVVEVEPRP